MNHVNLRLKKNVTFVAVTGWVAYCPASWAISLAVFAVRNLIKLVNITPHEPSPNENSRRWGTGHRRNIWAQ